MKNKILPFILLLFTYSIYSQDNTENNNLSEIIPFNEIENPPLAPECKSKWKVEKRKECTQKYISMFLAKKFNTDLALEIDYKGRVKIEISFIIDEKGKATNIAASGGPEIMQKNAIEVIRSMPNLEPGTVNNKPTRVSYMLPLVFQIQ